MLTVSVCYFCLSSASFLWLKISKGSSNHLQALLRAVNDISWELNAEQQPSTVDTMERSKEALHRHVGSVIPRRNHTHFVNTSYIVCTTEHALPFRPSIPKIHSAYLAHMYSSAML